MKRLLSVIILLVMVVSLLPISTFAAEQASASTAGTFGDNNFNWHYDPSSATLTISGKGEMSNVNPFAANVPWGAWIYSTKEVIFEPGITSIGNNICFEMFDLERVSIPEGVTKIGITAFAKCESLKEIELPASLTVLDASAFARCSALNTIILHSSPEILTNQGFGLFDFEDVEATIYYPESTTWAESDMHDYNGKLTWKAYTGKSPTIEPPLTEPPVTEPPVTEPPATEPPATEPILPTITGTYTTDLVMPASDLGVSAPDAVLRATLTFTEDGKATVSWEAVDLTAFKVFFHEMFVNSYYTMAYGAGITDINEIEAFCQESTGMSVSAYMDTIVTDEAMKTSFTPASTSGTYTYNDDHSAIFTDMAIMDVLSNPAVENSFVLGDGTLYLNAASYEKPDYTFVCKAK